MTAKNILVGLVVVVLVYFAYRWYNKPKTTDSKVTPTTSNNPSAPIASATATNSNAPAPNVGNPIPSTISNTTTTVQQTATPTKFFTPSALLNLDEIGEVE